MSNTQSSTSSERSSTERSELQVRSLLGEIAQHAQRDVPPDEFHAEFLRRVVAALGAVGGGFWTLERGNLALAYQINIQELHLDEKEDAEKHARMLVRLLGSPDTGTLLPPHSGTEGDNDMGNPTDHLLICCPIRTELEIVGVVEIIHRADAPIAVQQGFVQFLAQTCRFATDYYKNRQLRHFGERQNLWVVLEDFTRTIHQSLDPKWTAYTVANEGRRLIGCDRVSVALRHGKKCPIAAVSGQDTVNKRSTTVRLLGKLAGAVLKAGEPLWYTGDTSDFPPQIERTIEKYVDESHSKMIAVYPLFHRKKEHEKEQLDKRRRHRLRPFGVLIVEQLGDSQLTEQTRKRTDIVAEHAGSALGNALEHQSIFLLPLWKMIGKSKKLVTGETLPKTLAVVALIIALFATLVFLPWDLQMHCEGTLEPINRKRIYSQIEAEIKQLFVVDGSKVVGPSDGLSGTVLLELRSPELESLEIELQGSLLEIGERLLALTRQLQDPERQLNEAQRADLVGQKDRAEIQLETVKKKLEIFEHDQQPHLFITSPINGVVVSWDVERRLIEKKPISRMQYVMEVADLDGDWQLELLMPEKRMGYIMEQKRRQPDVPLRVECVLATTPSVKYYGTVTAIHDRAEVRSESGGSGASSGNLNTVSIKVKLDDLDLVPLSDRRPGADVSARINCGKHSLGYVLFYEVIVYVQKNVLFRWF